MVLLFMTENVIETVWYDRDMYVAALVCVEAGKCYYMNVSLYNALKQACVIHKCHSIVIRRYSIDSLCNGSFLRRIAN